MGWPRHTGLDDLDDLLASLPDGIEVRALGGARFVLGPTGAHVVVLDDGSPDAPREAALLASIARTTLADRVAWVPFVHALLVTERDRPCPPATRVPPTLLAGALVDGPPVLGPGELARLVACVRGGALDALGASAADGAVASGR